MINVGIGEETLGHRCVAASAKIVALEIAAAHMNADHHVGRTRGHSLVDAVDVEVYERVGFCARARDLLPDRRVAQQRNGDLVELDITAARFREFANFLLIHSSQVGEEPVGVVTRREQPEEGAVAELRGPRAATGGPSRRHEPAYIILRVDTTKWPAGARISGADLDRLGDFTDAVVPVRVVWSAERAAAEVRRLNEEDHAAGQRHLYEYTRAELKSAAAAAGTPAAPIPPPPPIRSMGVAADLGGIPPGARDALRAVIAEQGYPLIFATLSGAHLYGFPSADSDYDVRGVHVLPTHEVIGLGPGRETIERSILRDGHDIDLATHDARKFFLLLLKRNGYVLEQLYSPLIVHTTAEHDELRQIARGCLTRHHAQHYLGFARTQWTLVSRARQIKPLLYVYRVLLTGIHLLRSGEVEANLPRLNEHFRLPRVDELIARKIRGREQERLGEADVVLHEQQCQRLTAELEQAREASRLPDAPTARAALNDLLTRLRR